MSPLSSPSGARRHSGNFGFAGGAGGVSSAVLNHNANSNNTSSNNLFGAVNAGSAAGSGASTPARRDSRGGGAGGGEGADRFIPHRSHLDIDLAAHLLGSNENDRQKSTDAVDGAPAAKSITTVGVATRTHLGVISNVNNASSRLLSFGARDSSKSVDGSSVHDDGFCRLKYDKSNDSQAVTSSSPINVGIGSNTSPTGRHSSRYIPSQPSRILDAPDLMDDYYLNLLSWGQNNVIAVALNQSVYLWHAADGHIDPLLALDGDDYVTSVQWSGVGDNTLAVGTSANTVQLWDASALSKIRDLNGHSSRVSSLSWNGSNNPNLLSSGSRDATVLNHDIRSSRNIQDRLCGHNQEICGLAWSPDGTTLASGGNENRLCIWDAAMSRASSGASTNSSPRFSIDQHQAAVKAVSWCPWQRNILASGGGTADRTIRIWNTSTGNNLRTTDTGSQVCAIQWSKTEKELVSSHGFSDNQIILWKYGTRSTSMTKIREFHGHNSRVLHLAQSPDGSTICSASADETIRFWDIFGPVATNAARRASGGDASSARARGGGTLFNTSDSFNSASTNTLNVR